MFCSSLSPTPRLQEVGERGRKARLPVFPPPLRTAEAAEKFLRSVVLLGSVKA